ncbi:MAG: hypothetical protein IH830_12585 [Planctomycetes bacterium]|nr:hypothetical protein [Planctomycetota bacterium]
MRSIPTKLCLTVPALMLLMATTGCYEEISADDQPSSPPTVQQGPTYGVSGASGSALGGAKRAAQNTVDKVQQRQRDIENKIQEDE